MKSSSKLIKKEQTKSDIANSKDSANNEPRGGETTPEIAARSRKSLDGIPEDNEYEKDQQIELMNEHVMQQQRELENLREALRESQEERQATYVYGLQGNK